MVKYHTRVCNFYSGQKSKEKVKKGSALPLSNNNSISFDTIEIITRKYKKKIHIKEINLFNFLTFFRVLFILFHSIL